MPSNRRRPPSPITKCPSRSSHTLVLTAVSGKAALSRAVGVAEAGFAGLVGFTPWMIAPDHRGSLAESRVIVHCAEADILTRPLAIATVAAGPAPQARPRCPVPPSACSRIPGVSPDTTSALLLSIRVAALATLLNAVVG